MNKKANRICRVMVAIAALAFMTGQIMAAQIVSKVEDKSVAFRVYNGYTGTVSWVVGSDTTIQTNTVTCDGNDNTLLSQTASANCTIGTLATNAVAMCTNLSGTASLKINAEPSLAADSTIGTLLPGTYSITPSTWGDIYWDTSAALHYDLYLPSRTYQTGVAPYVLESIRGVPGGTGKLTTSIYKDGTLVNQRIDQSPVYVNASTFIITAGAYTNTYGVVNDVTLDWTVDMPFSGEEAVIIRSTRATTATSGVLIGVIPTVP